MSHNKPCSIQLTEEGCFNLPEYMGKSRRFRIEYRDPASGYSNFEGVIYIPNVPNIYEITDKIEDMLEEAFGIERSKIAPISR